MNLRRLKDLPDNFPVKKNTLYRWKAEGKYPLLLVKFAGALCVDLDQVEPIVELQKKENNYAATKN